MENYIFHCFRSGDSNGRAMSAYSALLFWAKLEDITLCFSPTILLGLRAFKRLYKRQREVLWVTIQDLNSLLALWSEVQLPHWVLLTLSFFTLVRPSEILHIKWGEIFLPEKYVYLPWSKNDPEGNGTYVTLLPQAHEALSRLLQSLPRPPHKKELVFPEMDLSKMNSWLESQCTKAGLPHYTWYHLKHGGATYLALLSWSFERIRRHGRWKSEASAKLYIHAPVAQ